MDTIYTGEIHRLGILYTYNKILKAFGFTRWPVSRLASIKYCFISSAYRINGQTGERATK